MAKRHGEKYWGAHLEAWNRSDLTQREYCAAHGLSEKSFYRWRAKEKEAIAAGKSSLTLVPIRVGTPMVRAAGNTVRLHSPGGWRVELSAGSGSWLADLLRHLP